MTVELDDAAVPSPLLRKLCRYLSERSPQPMVAVEGTTHVVIYVNPAFARLTGREPRQLVGHPFTEAVPEGKGNGCIALLDRAFRTGSHEILGEQEHRQALPRPVFWSYSVWAILGEDERPAGVMVQVTDSTETAAFRRQMAAINEALVISSVRQHELAATTESLNAQLLQAQDELEVRVAERTAELRTEIVRREIAEADRRNLQLQLTTVQEGERRRISRELHDQLGQHLTALGLGLKVVKDASPNPCPLREKLQALQSMTDRIGRDIHQLALELRPTALDDIGLHAALANYAEAWAELSGIDADLHVIGLDTHRLPPAVETALYRIVQEALTNILKHAGAERVSVVLQRSADLVSVVVEDDGKGFDAEAVSDQRLGILGMRERAVLVGGTLVVESGAGRGATIITRIPLFPSDAGRLV